MKEQERNHIRASLNLRNSGVEVGKLRFIAHLDSPLLSNNGEQFSTNFVLYHFILNHSVNKLNLENIAIENE